MRYMNNVTTVKPGNIKTIDYYLTIPHMNIVTLSVRFTTKDEGIFSKSIEIPFEELKKLVENVEKKEGGW